MSDPTPLLKASAKAQAMAALYSGFQAKREAGQEADVLSEEAKIVAQQSVAAQDAQRRQARQFLSMQSVMVGESGTGYGGSSGVLMKQSAIEAELEALNIRYAGDLKVQGLNTRAQFAKQRGTSALIGSGLAAGSALLSGEADVLKSKSGLVQYGYPIGAGSSGLNRL
jgi:hypothetical protein